MERKLSMSEMPQPLTENDGEQRCLNSELWHACAGPLVSLPAVGSRVIYFPQGHSEQADAETDEVYAQMTLQSLSPVPMTPRAKGAFSSNRAGLQDFECKWYKYTWWIFSSSTFC